ncbi:MAG: hypothetical protein HWN68_14955 [Desulfobacterales bacterium]|nr:hypothetical protein [Desulfobacterales bacterium]
MTLTNHIRKIQELAGGVSYLCDQRKYHEAHVDLDKLQCRLYAVRRHIEHLQNVVDFCPRPAGDDS